MGATQRGLDTPTGTENQRPLGDWRRQGRVLPMDFRNDKKS